MKMPYLVPIHCTGVPGGLITAITALLYNHPMARSIMCTVYCEYYVLEYYVYTLKKVAFQLSACMMHILHSAHVPTTSHVTLDKLPVVLQ